MAFQSADLIPPNYNKDLSNETIFKRCFNPVQFPLDARHLDALVTGILIYPTMLTVS